MSFASVYDGAALPPKKKVRGVSGKCGFSRIRRPYLPHFYNGEIWQ
jgi:hypothetical protein